VGADERDTLDDTDDPQRGDDVYEGSEACDTCTPTTGGGRTYCLYCGLQLGVLALVRRATGAGSRTLS
jgi:hypothetical protein